MVRHSVVCGLLVLVSGSLVSKSQADPINFNRDIRPILSDRCFHCHGPSEENREADLRLDVADGDHGALRDVDGATPIKPGDLQASLLWERIMSEDEDVRMPPPDSRKKPLSAEEQELIKQWILQGAKYDQFWAFTTPMRRRPSNVQHADWRNGLIDPYIMARLEAESLAPKSQADKRTLIRRVTF